MSSKGVGRGRAVRACKRSGAADVEKEEQRVKFQSSTTRVYSASSVLRVPDDWKHVSAALTTRNLRKCVDTVVENLSRALFTASLVLDGYVRLCHERGEDMAFKVGIRQAMAVCVKGALYPSVERVGTAFEQLVPVLEKTFCVKRPSGAGTVLPVLWIPGQALTFASNAMWSTTLWLYSTEAIWKHVDAVVRAKFPDLTTDQRDHVLQRLQGEEPEVPKSWQEEDVRMVQGAWDWLEGSRGLVDRLKRLVQLMSSADLQSDRKNATRDLIMSQAASIRIEMLQLMDDEIGKDKEMNRRFRRFGIVPEFGARRHFVRVDKVVLRDVLQSMLGPVEKESRKRARKPHHHPAASEEKVACTNVRGAGAGADASGGGVLMEGVDEDANGDRAQGEAAVGEAHGQAAHGFPSLRLAELPPPPPPPSPPPEEHVRKKGRNTRRRVVTSATRLDWCYGDEFEVSSARGRQAFLDVVEVMHVIKLPRSHAKKIVSIPNSWTTDGIQLHVTLEHTFERAVMWPKGKALPTEPLSLNQDVQSKRPCELAERVHGLYRADCVAMKHLEGLRNALGHDFNMVFVDPGVASIFTAVSMPFSAWKVWRGKVDQAMFHRDRGDKEKKGKVGDGATTRGARNGGAGLSEKEGIRHDGRGAEVRGVRRAEYYHMVGAKQDAFKGDAFYARCSKRNRRYGWSPPDVRKAYADLSEGGSIHVGGIAEALEAARKRISLLVGGCVWKFVSSRTHAQLRFQRTKRRQRALDKLAHRLAPGKHDVVVMGDWFGRRALKGEDLATPVRSFRRHLQLQRRVLVMHEHNTSCKCASCGPELGEACAKVDHPKRKRMLNANAWRKAIDKKQDKEDGKELTKEEKKELQSVVRRINGLSVCPHCKSCWSRDVNAACNFSCGFFHMCTHAQHERPPYLRRSSMQQPAATIQTSGSPVFSDCASEPRSRSPSLS